MKKLIVPFLYIILLTFSIVFQNCSDDPTQPSNQKPKIESLTSDNTSPVINSTLLLTCIATDADGDALSIIWKSTTGVFPEGNVGITVKWLAPSFEGLVSITVTVNDGREITDQTLELYIGENPATPVLVFPLNYGSNVTLNPLFKWKKSNKADTYNFQLATDNQFTNVIFDRTGIIDTTQQVDNLTPSSQYYWRVSATNSYSTSTWSAVFNFSTYDLILINELYSQGTLGNSDWVEIYNPSPYQIDLSGYKIYDSDGLAGTKPKKEITSGTIIPANGFYVIVADDSSPSGFDLSTFGEQIWLENSTDNIIDDLTFPSLGIDSSYARKPDGSINWQIISPPTKGFTNTGGSGTNLPLVMNEFFWRGVDPDFDWIEIYNPNPVQVELTGYKIYDGGGNLGTKPKMEFPVGAVVPASGFYVIVVDVQDPAGFGLGSGGDECWLENPAGTIIDNQVIPAMPVITTSYCRLPDGSTNWVISNTITKGAPNQP